MFRRLCLLFLLFFTTIVVDAQEQNLYFPSADEYIAAIPEILDHSPPSDFGIYDSNFVGTIADDFLFRYGETASPAEILAAFHALDYGDSLYANYFPYLNHLEWHQLILERLIELNAIDFSTETEFSFETYTVTATQYEVDGDAEPEWLLYGKETDFWHYWLVQTDESSATGYRLYPLPIPFRAINFWPAQLEWTGSSLYQVLDLTGDGNVDFMFTGYYAMPASWTSAGYDYLYVVSWGDGQLQQIFRGQPIVDDGYDYWQARNLDGDAALEIVQNVTYFDNYYCSRRAETRFDYVDGLYSVNSETSTFDEDFFCALRQGQEAMDDAEYELALSHFLNARERFPDLSVNQQDYNAELLAYANERMIVAYAMLNRIPEAITEIQQMNENPQPENTMASAWASAIEDGTDALELCTVAYDTLGSFEWNQNYRDIVYVGRINEAMYGEFNAVGIGSVAGASCDLFALLQSMVYMQEYPLSEAPESILAELGISLKVWTYELNHDSYPESLIWLNVPNRAFFFYSRADEYQVSEALIWWPDENHRLYPVTLPENNVGIGATGAYNHYDCQYGYLDDEQDATGTVDLDLWTINDGVLTVSYPGEICIESEEIARLELGEELEIWRFRDGDPAFRDSYFLVWDSETKSYVYREALATPEPEPQLAHPLPFVWDIRESLYKKRDFEETLILVDELLPSATMDDLQQLHYYRAFALIGLSRNEEALAELQMVVDMNAYSVYGLLASLNLR